MNFNTGYLYTFTAKAGETITFRLKDVDTEFFVSPAAVIVNTDGGIIAIATDYDVFFSDLTFPFTVPADGEYGLYIVVDRYNGGQLEVSAE